ncbi:MULTISPECIES: murein hydrolase activator EnvC family protein [Flavobacterium]|jgi:murein DD-endopeptidase MepM/ murein hydrolase activator NlpD|uniref:Peptidase M23-like protein n=2 Tax=Flavobacterium TaxID=237 RepID=A0A562KH92_9FLAO|nr:M23 family metallopeptidase [Flavobacterium cheniae]TDR24543.1 peptidase M23-like protein [Flavobacterium cheniae]TWH94798.1 peptidase M23-like protein [Flavobacterium cheniae]
MANKKLKRQLLLKKLYNKRRLVILNEDTFEETFSLKLNLMNVFVVGTIGAILIIFVTTYIIAFTPLREYIPGYASSKLKQDALEMAIKSDSLEKSVKINNAYIASIKKVLTGDLEYAKLNKDSIKALDVSDIDVSGLSPTEKEQELRDQVIKEDKYNVFESSTPKVSFVLFPPAQGSILQKYNAGNKHLAVTIALTNNTPIKSVGAGTIIFSDWTPSSGYVVIVRHKDDILSVYKNAASVTKKQGNTVKAGEVIALAGNANTVQNSGATLHFELWKDGFPIDPTQFINFN